MQKEQQIEKWKKRPMSWSQLALWDWSKEDWYNKYILGIPQSSSPELEFGKKIGKRLETDPSYLPQISRHNKMEHPFNVNFSGILLTGFADSFCTITNKKLAEFKTGVKKWDKKRVDGHHQLTMYALMHYITTKVKPEDVEIQLVWMPTQRKESGNFEVEISFVEPIEDNIKIFKTKRTMVDIVKFGMHIKEVYNKMQAYAEKYESTL